MIRFPYKTGIVGDSLHSLPGALTLIGLTLYKFSDMNEGQYIAATIIVAMLILSILAKLTDTIIGCCFSQGACGATVESAEE